MDHDVDAFTAAQHGTLPGELGIEWTRAAAGEVDGRLAIERRHLAPTGFLHAATVVALADTACGFGCLASLPQGATGFTTAELKANYLGTAREGVIRCEARAVHLGRTTQVWDAKVIRDADDAVIALFRCTQIVLHPRR